MMGFYRHRMPDREIQMAKDWTQEKLIDTLKKECEQLRGWYIAKIDQNAELQTQIESCSAEIERLREALKRIGNGDTCMGLMTHPPICKRAYDARTALKDDE
jgi:septal ring factor EnvC (AmiA/AmiB activator)